ncbi:Seed maturation protein [Penicillium sp. IBT 31633x]|nr:Seed maturation protein [Penicillium sp. IBT 31633x]
MSLDIPTVAEIQLAAESGQRITQADVSAISQAESALTGRGPARGGPAATAQSLAMRQMNFENKVAEVSRKPSSAISLEDADEIQATEGRAFNQPPGVGYISAQVRSIADNNEALGLTAAANVGAFVTKDDSRDAQHAESLVYGGQNPRGGMAAKMQSAADKIDNARRGSFGSY